MNIPRLPITMKMYTTDMGICMVLERLAQLVMTMRPLSKQNTHR